MGRFAEAQAHLDAITNEMYAGIKKVLVRNLKEEQSKEKGTNAPPASEEKEKK